MAIVVGLVASIAGPARSEEESPFKKGNVRFSILAGWGRAFSDDYFILGVGASYFVMKGLETGLDFEAWLGGRPDVYKLSPHVRYIYDRADLPLKPYGGFLYRRTFIQDLDDQNSIGLRGGAFYKGGKGSWVGAGVLYERYLDCDDAVLGDCSRVYPEVVVSLKF
jgi:ribosome modulation factor